MRILILNWRDIAHPRAGGAERVTFEIARRWVQWGHTVTWFAGAFPGAAWQADVDGIEVWRAGSQTTVHLQALRHYRRHFAGRVDVILDEVNTLPFCSPLYAREPVVLYLNQLAREVWFYESPWPIAGLGYLAEPFYLQAYRRCPVVTISASTAHDVRRLGLRGPVTIMPMAVDLAPLPRLSGVGEKERDLTLAFVGRVVPSKRVPDLIRALASLRDDHGIVARLWIVGTVADPYRRVLERLIEGHGLATQVTFWGHVSADQKRDLLQRAHALVMASVREGWGLVVTEAARVGTPAVVYDVPGLRDSTTHGETGLVCARNSPEALARAVATSWKDRGLYTRLRCEAWQRSRALGWEEPARLSLNVLWDAVQARRRRL